MSLNASYASLAPDAKSQPAAAFDRLAALAADDLAAVNALIHERMHSAHAPMIAELAAHLIEAGGKRLRPILTLASARMSGGARPADAVKLAAAVEFIHTATLLHDDVVDESAQRRGRPSANFQWGNKPSILVGDFLFSRAFQLMVETGSVEVLKTLSDASAVISEGEVLQLSHTNQISADDTVYMTVIRAKTAALFEAATVAGGMVGGAGAAQREALRVYGDALGVGFQLIDDALDYGGVGATLGKNTGDDFREGKATLPAILAFAAGDETAQAFWKRCIQRRDQSAGDLEHALHLMAETGALRDTIARAEGFVADAKRALAVFEPSPLRDALSDVADFVIARAH